MPTLASIEIEKSYLHFSAAHFTIFSATNRERLHGHNWRLAVEITGEVGDEGLCFDYAIYKKILKDLCAKYDEYTLIAEQLSQYFLTELTKDQAHLDQLNIHAFEVRVSSGPNQWGIARWSR